MLILKKRYRAFTLVELLAVVLVISILTGMAIAVASYVQRKAGISATRAELCSIETALDAYRGDNGYYPRTLFGHYSEDFTVEKSNSFLLARALMGGSRKYVSLSAKLLATDSVLQIAFIIDSFQRPVNYYCINPPTNALVYTNWTYVFYNPGMTIITNFLATGGQMNVTTFDLFSYGPDQRTYLPGTTGEPVFNDPTTKTDDISCSK